MKKYKYIIILALNIAFVVSCSDKDNDMSPGNPVIEAKTQFTKAYFGDNLSFTIGVSDPVPLSTLTAKLYFGDEEVAKTVIRTKTDGDYSGTIPVPFFKEYSTTFFMKISYNSTRTCLQMKNILITIRFFCQKSRHDSQKRHRIFRYPMASFITIAGRSGKRNLQQKFF